jgi:hypothetical protein
MVKGLMGQPEPSSAGIASLDFRYRLEHWADEPHLAWRQGKPPQPAALDQALGLTGACMGGEQQPTALLNCPDHRNRTSVGPREALKTVALVAIVGHHYQPQVPQGCEGS